MYLLRFSVLPQIFLLTGRNAVIGSPQEQG
jgi:hypothetical protein